MLSMRCIAAVQPHDQANALFQAMRKNVVRDLKARLGGVPVDRGDIFEEVIAGLPSPPRSAATMTLSRNGDGQLVAIELRIGGQIGQALTAAFSGMRLEDGCLPFTADGGVVH